MAVSDDACVDLTEGVGVIGRMVINGKAGLLL